MIGVAAVIVMVTLGSGATAQVTENIASLGSNLLMSMPGQQGGPAQSAVTPLAASSGAAKRSTERRADRMADLRGWVR